MDFVIFALCAPLFVFEIVESLDVLMKILAGPATIASWFTRKAE